MLTRFLIQAERIVAEHRAQYHGVYYMKGGGGILDTVLNVVAAAVGNAAGGPFGAAGADFLTNKLEGHGNTGSLEGAALAGAGSGIGDLATGGSLTGGGIGGVENLFSSVGNTLGLTGDGGIFSGTPSTGAAVPGASSVSGAPSTAPSAGAGPGAGVGNAGGGVSPSSVGAVSPDATSSSQPTGLTDPFSGAGGSSPNAGLPTSQSTNLGSVANQVGSPSTSTANVGTGNPGSQGLGVDGSSSINTSALNQPLGLTDPYAPAGGGSPPNAGLPTSSPDSLLGKVGSEISGAFGKANPASLAISGGGLALDAIKQQQTLKGENQLKSIAANEMTQGSMLQNYLQTGTLPPGLQAGLNQATQAAAATIKSRYAAQGMSGSSAEQTDLANLQQTAQAQGGQMALQLLQTGISETGMASSLYEQILNETLQKDSQLGGAISNFASAAAGGSPGGKQTITIGGT